MQGPLSGLSIAEAVSSDCPLAVRLSIAMAGRVASDLGASVVCIEPAGGDPLRRLGPRAGDGGAPFAFLSAGKKLVSEPNADAAARRALLQAQALLADSVMAARLAEAGAGKIVGVASLHNGGAEAPANPSEFTLMALGGLLDLVGAPDRQPLKIAGAQLAYAAGLSLFSGLTAALYATAARGAEIVRVNLFDMAVWLNWKSVAAASWGVATPTRLGADGEWQTIRCKDGWLALIYRDPDWATLKALVASPVLEEPRFQKRIERKRQAGEVARIVEAALMSYTRAEVREIARAKRLPIGPVWTLDELGDDPQTLARGMLAPLAANGRMGMAPRLPLLWNGAGFVPAVAAGAAPARAAGA